AAIASADAASAPAAGSACPLGRTGFPSEAPAHARGRSRLRTGNCIRSAIAEEVRRPVRPASEAALLAWRNDRWTRQSPHAQRVDHSRAVPNFLQIATLAP